MKRVSFFALTALFLIVSFSISAQTYYQAGFTLGSNYSTLRSDLFTTASGRLGMSAGCSFTFGLSDRFELNPEFVFTQKGASAKAVRFMPEEKIEETAYDFHYYSFEAGLMAGYKPAKDVPVRLQTGGFFGSHVVTKNNSNTDVWVGDYQNVNNAFPVAKLNNAFSGLDFGPVAGISAGEGQLRFNIRYYLGLKNLYNNLDFMKTPHSIRTGALRASITYFLK
jgi:hypothetical protein